MGLILCARPRDDGIVVEISGEVDVCTQGTLRQALLRIMRERGARLLLDVSGVSFMDCAGLRALLRTRRRAELRGGFMCLIATSAAVRRIIELTGTHEALAVDRDGPSVQPKSCWSMTARGSGHPMNGGCELARREARLTLMMHVRFSLITADPQVLAGCLGFLEGEARPVLESQDGSLGLSLLAGEEPGVAIVESLWASHGAFLLSTETDALVRGELARRVGQPVTAEDFEVPVFEREAPLRSGEAVRLTRVKIKPPGVPDVVDVYGDTAVPQLADTPGFCGALLFAAPARGRLISQTIWRDPAARAASTSVASVLRNEVLAEEECEIRDVEDYSMVFNSARKVTVPLDQ